MSPNLFSSLVLTLSCTYTSPCTFSQVSELWPVPLSCYSLSLGSVLSWVAELTSTHSQTQQSKSDFLFITYFLSSLLLRGFHFLPLIICFSFLIVRFSFQIRFLFNHLYFRFSSFFIFSLLSTRRYRAPKLAHPNDVELLSTGQKGKYYMDVDGSWT